MVLVSPRFLQPLLGPKVFWVSLTAVVVLQIYLMQLLGHQTGDLLSLQLTVDPTSFADIFHAWSAAEYDAYRRHFTADFAYLCAYAVFLYNCLSKQMAGLTDVRIGKALVYLPFVAAAFDYAENVLHLSMTEGPVLANAHLVPLAFAAASLKWALLVTTVCVLIITSIRE